MKPSNGKTVWQHEGKKWRARNFQAVKVLWPAHGMHHPPEEVKQPVFAVPFSEQLAAERSERAKRVEKLIAEYGRTQPLKKKSPFKNKPKKVIANFAAKQNAKLAKMVKKAAQAAAR